MKKKRAVVSVYNPNAPEGQRYTNRRPINDPYLNALRDSGAEFWRRRGLTVPDLSFSVADDLDEEGQHLGILGRANTSGQVTLESRATGIELRRARSKRRSTREKRKALERLAETIYHEIGHTAGMQHSADGVMGDTNTELPYDAEVLIRKLIPRRKKNGRSRQR